MAVPTLWAGLYAHRLTKADVVSMQLYQEAAGWARFLELDE